MDGRFIGAIASVAHPPRNALGVAVPRFGWLTEGMVVAGPAVAVGDLVRPRIEPRLGFVLARSVHEPIPSASALLAATSRVIPCLEAIAHSRQACAGAPADTPATVRLVTGTPAPPPAEGHVRRLRVRLAIEPPFPEPAVHGGVVGISALEVVRWLVERLLEHGHEVAAGTLLVAPVGTAAVELAAGITVRADFGHLPGVAVHARH